MDSKTVKREELKVQEDPKLLSPPIVSEPLYQCASALTVVAYAPNADIEVQIDGASLPSVPGGFPMPNGVTIALPNALIANQKVRARQKTAAAQSDWSPTVTVRDHTKDYPAGPPRPEINPAPVYNCGVRTGVGNLLTGGNVWITSNGAEVGRVNGCAEQQGVNVNPPYGPGQKVRAWFELCKDPSPPSVEYTTQNAPNPLPQLTFDPYYAGGQTLVIRNVVNGTKVTVSHNGSPLGTWPCWGYALQLDGLGPFASGDKYDAVQTMCPGDPPSKPGQGTAQPCSSLPAPEVGPVQAGDDRITLTQFVPDAVIRVYLNNVLVGISGGPVVLLSKQVAHGDTLIVVQDLLDCKSQYALVIKVACVDPPVGANPATLDLFPIGWLDYKNDGIEGRVYYPAEDDGEKQPFNERLAKVGRTPIVFMAHGNHATHYNPQNRLDERSPNCGQAVPANWPEVPSHKGYEYFQAQLAQMGIIAVSVDCNTTNGCTGGVSNIEQRADLIIDNIAYFQGLDTDHRSPFFGRIDFNHLGLMGHSRGGDAVVMVPTVISLAGVIIRSVLALAPTNFRFWAGMSTIQPKDHAFITILPAGDGDVTDNNGAQFYDLAIPSPFKSQLYVHYANHNFFNREWPHDDSLNYSQPAVMARFDHERILTAYGCALFRASLLGHNTIGYLAGDQLPAGVQTPNVHLSFDLRDPLTVDNYEDKNTIAKNSLGQPNTQLAGMSADEYDFAQQGATYNSSFYGATTGMVVKPGEVGRMFRWALNKTLDLTTQQIWVRAAEVSDGSSVPSGATGFQLGLEDKNGNRVWMDCNDVGGLPRPYARNPGMIKTMLKTLCFKGACFRKTRRFDLKSVQAILVKCDRKDQRAIAFDDLQIVK